MIALECCEGLQPMFNPIALRKAKIVCSVGLSECSRVKVRNQNEKTFSISRKSTI